MKNIIFKLINYFKWKYWMFLIREIDKYGLGCLATQYFELMEVCDNLLEGYNKLDESYERLYWLHYYETDEDEG